MANKIKIGIIGEDYTDVDCLKILINKIIADKFDVKGCNAGGCGSMFNEQEMVRLASTLSARGCQYLLVVRDLDRNSITNELNDLNDTTLKLKKAVKNSPIANKCIVIPIEELEAWLLSDRHKNPQSIIDPKRYFKKLDRNYRTSKNAKIAEKIDISLIWNRCPSFRPLQEFIKNIA
jgi:hypothetical protein